MRFLPALSIVAAVTPAFAEDASEVPPLPRTAIGAAFVVALEPGAPSTVGPGAGVELALGRGRVQYFGEASVHWTSLATADASVRGGYDLAGARGVFDFELYLRAIVVPDGVGASGGLALTWAS